MTRQWKSFFLANPPAESGIYAIKAGNRWLYIGRSKNIARRITSKKHPVQITSGLMSLTLSYQWLPISKHLASVEYELIDTHQPEWNGGTSFSDGGGHGPACDIPIPMTNANWLLLLAAIEPEPTP